FDIVDQNRVETLDGGKKRRFELRGDHRLTQVNSADTQKAFPDRSPGDKSPRHCTTFGQYAAFIRENVTNSPDPPARTLVVINEAGPKADCQKMSNFKLSEDRVPERVIASFSLGYFP